jgi:hypothetical protein
MRKPGRQTNTTVAPPPPSEGVNKIGVSFAMQYANGLSQAESKPVINCYFSSPVHGNVLEVAVPENDSTHATRVLLEGTLGSGMLLPKDTEVVFYQTCQRKNEFTTECTMPAGIAVVPLQTLMDLGSKNTSMELTLKMPSADWLEKGKIRISMSSKEVRIDSRIQWEAAYPGGDMYRRVGLLQNGQPEPEQTSWERARIEYINKVMRTEVAMPNTFRDTSNVRIPIYYGDFGMMNVRAPLPAAAYFMCKVPLSNRLFWTNALDVVLAREGKTVHDVDRATLDEQSRIMADMICLVIHGTDYIPDFVDRNKRTLKNVFGFIGENAARPFDPALVDNGENFSDLMRTLCGDCEDMGLGLGGQIFPAFLAANFDDHRQLKRLKEIAQQYVAVMTLDSVMGAAVGDGKRKLGAHIKCNFLPAIWVKRQMDKAAADLSAVSQAARALIAKRTTTAAKVGRKAAVPLRAEIGVHMGFRIGDSMAGSPGEFSTGKAVAEHIAATYLANDCIEVIGEAIADQQALPWKPFAPWADQLSCIIAEGTGMYETRDRKQDALHEARITVDKDMPSLRGMKKPLLHAAGAPSPFFVGSMVGFTSYWFEQGANVGGMWLGYTEPGCKTMQRGITFEELAAKSDHISMLAHPAFTAECKADIERALRIRIPPRDLILTPEGLAAHSVRSAKLDELAAFCKEEGRRIQPGNMAAPFYIRDHQLTPEIMRAIKGDIRNKSSIVGIAYKLEPVTDWMCIYRTGVYVK